MESTANKGIPVLMFSLEESRETIMKQITTQSTQVYIDDTPKNTIDEIVRTAEELKAEKNIGLIVIDYIQLIDGNCNNQEKIVNELKLLVHKLDIPVIVTSHLSQVVEDRPNKIPTLADICNGYLIEQSDTIYLLSKDNVELAKA